MFYRCILDAQTLPEGRVAPLLTYIRGLVLGRTRKTDSDIRTISSTTCLIFTGREPKSANFGLNYWPQWSWRCSDFKRAAYRESITCIGSAARIMTVSLPIPPLTVTEEAKSANFASFWYLWLSDFEAEQRI